MHFGREQDLIRPIPMKLKLFAESEESKTSSTNVFVEEGQRLVGVKWPRISMTSPQGLPFITFSFRSRIELLSSRIILSIVFAIMMARYNYLVNLAIVRMPRANVIAPVRFSLAFQIAIFDVSISEHVFMLTMRIEY